MISKPPLSALVYLIITSTLIAGALSSINTLNTQREVQQELSALLEETQERLAQAYLDNVELVEYQEELAEMCYIRDTQYELLSRGSRVTINLHTPSGFEARHFEQAFEALGKTHMCGLGTLLCAAETTTGVNAVVLGGIIAHESAWAASTLAQTRNNLAGLGAYDHSPNSAIWFEDRGACVLFLAELLEDSSTLDEVGNWYASDPLWSAKVKRHMRSIMEGADM